VLAGRAALGGGGVSVGERRRLLLARELLIGAEVLLLDDGRVVARGRRDDLRATNPA